jgi:hypothetical protein
MTALAICNPYDHENEQDQTRDSTDEWPRLRIFGRIPERFILLDDGRARRLRR